MKHGKKYIEAAKAVDRATLYDPAEAIALVKTTARAKFDETIEAHIRTGCDGRHADQQIRGAVVLPNGLVNRFVCLYSQEVQKQMRLLQLEQNSLEQKS